MGGEIIRRLPLAEDGGKCVTYPVGFEIFFDAEKKCFFFAW